MEINKVNFGNYTIGSYGKTQSNSQNTSEEKTPSSSANTSHTPVNPENILNSMNINGLHNQFQVNSAKVNTVNPADFLSQDRISDIEAMMESFENGVESVSNIIGNEFPNISEQNKNALAAYIYSEG